MAFERAIIAAAAIGGKLYFAYDENGDVVGVAGWFQPGHSFPAEYDAHARTVFICHILIFSFRDSMKERTR